VATRQVVLKALLRQRHLQGHLAFCKEYDRVAKRVEPDLVGSWPSKAQFYRWLSGNLKGLPYAHHCRVLEAMFPEWTAEQLFQPCEAATTPGPRALVGTTASPPAVPASAMADVIAIYPNRSALLDAMPPRRLLDGARRIRAMGLSLNLLCRHHPDPAALLESGTSVECLFLDPGGRHIGMREREQSHRAGLLSTRTEENIRTLRHVRDTLSPPARRNLSMRTYDGVPRFSITIVDDSTCVAQPYLPEARGEESPALVIRRRPGVGGLFDTFVQVFTSTWTRAQEIGA